jgi:hypothetical protein
VFCADDKTAIQALDRKDRILPRGLQRPSQGLATSYSITAFAESKSACGTVIPSALAGLDSEGRRAMQWAGRGEHGLRVQKARAPNWKLPLGATMTVPAVCRHQRTYAMQRRTITTGLISWGGLCGLSAWTTAHAENISEGDAVLGVRAALERGAASAVNLLGKSGGFLDNPKVRIPLPGFLNEVAKLAKFTGQQHRVDELVTAMNRAAEAAVPEAKALLTSAVKSMSVQDGRKILTGGDNSVTEFFASKTRAPLSVKFLPIVTKATEKVSLADKYNALAGKAASTGLVKKDDANIQQYVTGKALDGLYLMIGEEERKIRQDPIGTGSAILSKVFGSLK